jgi:hypothetical protein
MEQEGTMSLEQIRAFMEGSQEIRFEGRNRKEIYSWVRRTLIDQQYQVQGKSGKGLVREYVAKVTGLSRAQVTRLIGQYLATEEGGGEKVPQTTISERVHKEGHRVAS